MLGLSAAAISVLSLVAPEASGEFTSSPAPSSDDATPVTKESSPPPAESSPSTHSAPSPATTEVNEEPEALHKSAGADKPKIPHNGFVLDLRLGAIGCTKEICKRRHNAKPGFRIDGFIGGNINGWVDLGFNAGWGMMGSSLPEGTDGLGLYGLSVDGLGDQVENLNLDQFQINGVKLDTVQVGPNARFHFIPRGRIDPYLGIGIGYNLFRARYDTVGGKTTLSFHGLYVPFQAGFVVFPHKIVAIGAQFDYLLTWYGAASIRGAPGKFGAPLAALKDVAAEGDTKLPSDLPHFWTVGAVVHIRLGKSSS